MGISIQIIRKEQIKPALWDGGKTFEYYISPENSNYDQRSFNFRISSATIEKVPSDFTKFLGYCRYLIMLDNDLEVERNGKKEFYKKEELFKFDSSDTIQSFSLGHDFNLMIKKSKEDIAIDIKAVDFICNKVHLFFFALIDTQLLINGQLHALKQYACAVVANPSHRALTFQSDKRVVWGNWN